MKRLRCRIRLNKFDNSFVFILITKHYFITVIKPGIKCDLNSKIEAYAHQF